MEDEEARGPSLLKENRDKETTNQGRPQMRVYSIAEVHGCHAEALQGVEPERDLVVLMQKGGW